MTQSIIQKHINQDNFNRLPEILQTTTTNKKGELMKTEFMRKRLAAIVVGFVLSMIASSFAETGNRSLPGSPDFPHSQAPGNTCPKIVEYSVGGSRNIFSFDDFRDLKEYQGFKCAVNWYMGSGVADGGQTWDTFEPDSAVTRWEVAMNMYRFFAIMNETGCDLEDTNDVMTQYFLPSVQNLCGAGIYGKIESKRFHPYDHIQVQELLAWVYRAMNSPEAALKQGTHVEAGNLADLAAYSDAKDVSEENLAAVAGMIKAGYYTPKEQIDQRTHAAEKKIEPKSEARRIDMVNLLYVLANLRVPKTMNADVESRIKAVVTVDGGKKTIDKQTLAASGVNTSAIYAKNGAQVEVTNSKISTSSDMQNPSGPNVSMMGGMLAYRWGLDGGVVASGAGTQINISNSQATSTGKGAYVLYALLGGTINVKDSTLSRDDYTLFVANNGNITLENVKITGKGRSYSSDLGGGSITYKNVDSEKFEGGGGGGVMNDEWTTGTIINSTLKGDSYLSQSTGLAHIYMKDTTVETATGIEFRNNTSMPTDTASWDMEGGSLTFSNKCYVDKNPGPGPSNHICWPYVVRASHGERFIARFNGTKITLNNGVNLLNLTEKSQARLYFKNMTVGGDVEVEPGSSAEIYLDNATLTGKISGDVKVVQVNGPGKNGKT
jgi:hypothetical protein